MVPRLSKDILRAFRRCRRDTDFYRLQIALENILSPAEVADLMALRGKLPARAQGWVDELQARAFSEIAEPRPYERLRLGTHVWFYGHGPDEERRPHLLVAFCGSANRLMLPIPVFLQHLDASRFDVVVLTDPADRAYMAGIEAYAVDFDGIMRRLENDIDLGAYSSIRCLGSSIAGVVALRAGFALGAERAVSLSGRPIRSYQQAKSLPEHAVAAFDEALARRAEAPTRVICVHGAGHYEDTAGAAELAGRLGGETFPVPGVKVHNVLFEILKLGRLGGFLDEIMLGAPVSGAKAEAS